MIIIPLVTISNRDIFQKAYNSGYAAISMFSGSAPKVRIGIVAVANESFPLSDMRWFARKQEKSISERITVLTGHIPPRRPIATSTVSSYPQKSWISQESLEEALFDSILLAPFYSEERPSSSLYSEAVLPRTPYLLYDLIDELVKKQKEYRKMHKLLTRCINILIRLLSNKRNTGVGRSNTVTADDPMLLSIPTPPTAEAANRSLMRGGVVIANAG